MTNWPAKWLARCTSCLMAWSNARPRLGAEKRCLFERPRTLWSPQLRQLRQLRIRVHRQRPPIVIGTLNAFTSETFRGFCCIPLKDEEASVAQERRAVNMAPPPLGNVHSLRGENTMDGRHSPGRRKYAEHYCWRTEGQGSSLVVRARGGGAYFLPSLHLRCVHFTSHLPFVSSRPIGSGVGRVPSAICSGPGAVATAPDRVLRHEDVSAGHQHRASAPDAYVHQVMLVGYVETSSTTCRSASFVGALRSDSFSCCSFSFTCDPRP